ncbi:MAG: DUF2299 family protein [Candidatus Nitrosocosmicus sp.]|jgi:hypothetical protein|uniref:DUF2299 family protein n=1 Tax=Candidatus Nitrosocosmicus agrestis TaxID=2563600 RepID=UPI00122DD398|nr:DUF2299 family protein [Candidatus Nitrosocosmicus sp. SS]KAA2281551.1 DUF2299 domain-containing protein [Candidatus Nitrosocosmicus sp. SS]KAF0869754.1 DUF2299 domain-containing protein [Candidatus Nitrosocosmicus sp. SS]MDR4490350.1 DUF2299 family protein [Candidatus Nitrosocosmicus sp.]
MSEPTKKNNSQYENITNWLKNDPACNIDETLDDDNIVTIINCSYFEDFKIGVYVYKNDAGRVEIISSPRLLTRDGEILQNADDKIVNDFQTELTKDLLKVGVFCSLQTNKAGNSIGLTIIHPLFFDTLTRELFMNAVHAVARACLIAAIEFDKFTLDHQ